MVHMVQPGISSILKEASSFAGKNLALVTNDAAQTPCKRKSRIALLDAGFQLVKLFSPEHGVTTSGVDGVFQPNSVDVATGLPILSLYGDQLAPTSTDLEDVDYVFFDIPDVGCRFYTYLWTLTYTMESCEVNNIPMVILDRPNPISGNFLLAEGPVLDEVECNSFIGRWSIPLRHCCTLGELALYFAATRTPSLQLDVIPVKNWNRLDIMPHEDFIPTSPAIQNIESALLYPGMGLLEGINVNEGRGTEKPFLICGAPWMDANELQQAFEKQPCNGISSKPVSYKPVDGLYNGEQCHGLEFNITDTMHVRPVNFGIHLIQTITTLYPADIKERLYKTRAHPSGSQHLDKLLGLKNAFQKILRGEPIDTSCSEWKEIMKPFLLYG